MANTLFAKESGARERMRSINDRSCVFDVIQFHGLTPAHARSYILTRSAAE